MTEQEAREALSRFFLRYSTLDRWMENNYKICQVRRHVEIGAGRVVEARWEPDNKLSFSNETAGPGCRCRCNAPRHPDGIRSATWDSWWLVASVHDELLLEVVEENADELKKVLQETMIEALR